MISQCLFFGSKMFQTRNMYFGFCVLTASLFGLYFGLDLVAIKRGLLNSKLYPKCSETCINKCYLKNYPPKNLPSQTPKCFKPEIPKIFIWVSSNNRYSSAVSRDRSSKPERISWFSVLKNINKQQVCFCRENYTLARIELR